MNTKPDTVVLNRDCINQTIASRGLKKTWLAAKIGIDRNTLHRWLNGTVKRARRTNVDKLAQALALPPEDLVHSELFHHHDLHLNREYTEISRPLGHFGIPV